jgi:inner membrane protein
MTARTHDLAAITALGLTVLLLPLQPVTLSTVLVALLANQLGGIAPDVDQPTAPFWRNLPVGRLFGKVFDTLIGGHRFLSHSLIGVALFGFLASLLLKLLSPIMPHVDVRLVWYAFMIGVLSHLIMDTLTKEGVPWLLPIPIKFGLPPLKRLRVTTGTWRESFVVLPLLVLVNVWLVASHYAAITAFLHHGLVR